MIKYVAMKGIINCIIPIYKIICMVTLRITDVTFTLWSSREIFSPILWCSIKCSAVITFSVIIFGTSYFDSELPLKLLGWASTIGLCSTWLTERIFKHGGRSNPTVLFKSIYKIIKGPNCLTVKSLSKLASPESLKSSIKLNYNYNFIVGSMFFQTVHYVTRLRYFLWERCIRKACFGI